MNGRPITYYERLTVALEHGRATTGVRVVRAEDLADALSMIRSLRIANAEQARALEVLTAPEPPRSTP